MGSNPTISLYPKCDSENNCGIIMMEMHEGL